MAPDVKGIVTQPEGATVAFLLVHGLAASSDELATLGKYLAEKGYASFAVQLAGHGSTPEELKKTKWQDWFASAKRGLEVVRSWNPKHLFVVGLSMGGLLSILLTTDENDFDGLVLIGPALKVPSPLFKLTPVLKYIMKWREIDVETAQSVYDVKRFKLSREPVSAYHELYKLQRITKKRLEKVATPTMIIHGMEDKTIDPVSSQIIYDGIASEKKELHLIEKAEHVITCHPTRKEVYPHIQKFIQNILK